MGDPSRASLQTVLSALTPDQRWVLDRVYFGGYTTAECAATLQVAEPIVRDWMRIALRNLDAVMSQTGNHAG